MEPYKNFALMAGLKEMDHVGRVGRLAQFTEQRDASIAGLFMKDIDGKDRAAASPLFENADLAGGVDSAVHDMPAWAAELSGFLPEEYMLSEASLGSVLSQGPKIPDAEVADSVQQQYKQLRQAAMRDKDIAAILQAIQSNKPVEKEDAYASLKKLMIGGLGAGVLATAAYKTGAAAALSTGLLTGALGLVGITGAAALYMGWKVFKSKLDRIGKPKNTSVSEARGTEVVISADAKDILYAMAKEMVKAKKKLERQFGEKGLDKADTDRDAAKKVLQFARRA